MEQRAVRAIEKREQRAVDKWPLNGEREREREGRVGAVLAGCLPSCRNNIEQSAESSH